MQTDKQAGPWQRPRPSAKALGKPPSRTAAGARSEVMPLVGKADARAKARIGYETGVPRCENCTHYAKSRTFLVNSLPRFFPAQCRNFRLLVDPNASCDFWRGKDGELLVR